MTGDGTTSSVLFTGELLKYAERYISEGVHPRIIADGFELAQQRVLPFLERFKIAKPGAAKDRELLASVARTSLRTKLQPEMELYAACVAKHLKAGPPKELVRAPALYTTQPAAA